LSTSSVRIAGIAASLGVLALLIAPTIWSGYSVIRDTESSFPTAGPSTGASIADFLGFPGIDGNSNGRRASTASAGGQNFPFTPPDGAPPTNTALISYLEANQGDATFLVAVPGSNLAAPLILATNKPVMAMGGFSGNDPILTTSDLENLVSNGTVRFFLVNPPRSTRQRTDQSPAQDRETLPGSGGGNLGGQNALSAWISGHCSVVPARAWQSSKGGAGVGGSQLYDCASFNY